MSLPAARDREALERIDSNAFYRLCQLYQAYMSRCATAVTSDQILLNKQIVEVRIYKNNRIYNLIIINYKYYH